MMKTFLKNSFFILFLIIVSGCSVPGRGVLNIVNQSGVGIKELRVSLREKTKTFKNMKPGAEVEMTFTVRGDSHYHIEVEFEGGKFLVKDIGYLLRSMEMKGKMTITKDDILLKHLETKIIK